MAQLEGLAGGRRLVTLRGAASAAARPGQGACRLPRASSAVACLALHVHRKPAVQCCLGCCHDVAVPSCMHCSKHTCIKGAEQLVMTSQPSRTTHGGTGRLHAFQQQPCHPCQVAAWRVHRRLPLAVESSASLVEAVRMDQGRHSGSKTRASWSSDAGSGSVSDYSLRLRMALPIIK